MNYARGARALSVFMTALPALAAATHTSTVAIGPEQTGGVGMLVEYRDGTRPAAVGGTHSFHQGGVWLRLLYGQTTEELEFDSQLGVEYDVRLGYVQREHGAPEDRIPAELRVGFALPVRFFTWNVPCDGMLAARVGADFGLGGAAWWAGPVRLGLVGGLRGAARLGDDLRVELDYAAQPFTVSRAPAGLRVNHFEHRVTLTAGFGSVGVGAVVGQTLQRTTPRDGGPIERSSGRSLGILLQWRAD